LGDDLEVQLSLSLDLESLDPESPDPEVELESETEYVSEADNMDAHDRDASPGLQDPGLPLDQEIRSLCGRWLSLCTILTIG
jgi:hypothetical protein